MALKESGEMYLESIYILSKNGKNVRSIDVAEYMNFSKPSVSRALKLLKEGGFINVDNSGIITLSNEGFEIAYKIFERHTILAELLTYIGVDSKTAADDACKIEHAISDKSFEIIKEYFNKNKGT